jgi:dsRNA-specific ribonuclease
MFALLHCCGAYRALEPGQLHLLRSQRVSNANLGAAAVRLGLHQHVLLQAAGLAAAVQAAGATADAVTPAAAQQSGEDPVMLLGQLHGLTADDVRIWQDVWGVFSAHESSAAGEGAKSQGSVGAAAAALQQTTSTLGKGGTGHQPPLTGGPPCPKVLADVVEATAGAVWVDSGGDWVEVWRAVQFMLSSTLPLSWSN